MCALQYRLVLAHVLAHVHQGPLADSVCMLGATGDAAAAVWVERRNLMSSSLRADGEHFFATGVWVCGSHARLLLHAHAGASNCMCVKNAYMFDRSYKLICSTLVPHHHFSNILCKMC